jgi:hypothetical protein
VAHLPKPRFVVNDHAADNIRALLPAMMEIYAPTGKQNASMVAQFVEDHRDQVYGPFGTQLWLDLPLFAQARIDQPIWSRRGALSGR